MAKLYFYYSAMNAGKSTMLLQSAHNYEERGMRTIVLSPSCDNRYELGLIKSRIGLSKEAIIIDKNIDLFLLVDQSRKSYCVLVDEAQFLIRQQVYQLQNVAHNLNIPVLCFGLRTDFKGELFEGSQYLLAWADKLIELKTVCGCGKKATMTARFDDRGVRVMEGPQVEIGGNDKYMSLCWEHYWKKSDI